MTGLMLVPALVAYNITVWVGCRNLDTSACMALLSNSIASAVLAERATGNLSLEVPEAGSSTVPH